MIRAGTAGEATALDSVHGTAMENGAAVRKTEAREIGGSNAGGGEWALDAPLVIQTSWENDTAEPALVEPIERRESDRCPDGERANVPWPRAKRSRDGSVVGSAAPDQEARKKHANRTTGSPSADE
jgi:hypothetical protein